MNRTHGLDALPTEEVSRYLTVGEPVKGLSLLPVSYSPPFTTADLFLMAERIGIAVKRGHAYTITTHPSGTVWLTFPYVATKARRA